MEVINMEIYVELLKALENYFQGNDWKKYFLSGGCYWFANYLHSRVADSLLMINRVEEHCAIFIANGLYDVRGKISPYGFHKASEREICFMKKNYIPKFDVNLLEKYLLDKCDKLHKI